MSNQVEHITDIIQVLNSGIEFYTEAQKKVDDSALAGVFSRMVNVKTIAKEQLQPFAIIEEGEREDGSSFAVEARKYYTKMLTAFSSNEEHTIINQLEEVEDKTLAEIKAAMEKDQPLECQKTLTNVLNSMQQCHDEMLALQKATS
ncbi:ferritin-like domain-containing protein [Flocculibacter collagenilyticus]|uniref:ferritin-like domain-containing protein n=1 Tax=Flocculibacter collagenilyticus TaxID=2744479 RepID=UPI0018F40E10|nr:PA2169 family four-helix-bundle protein [Flocculibacter collagenilyticus]